jgi:hypothetical protein
MPLLLQLEKQDPKSRNLPKIKHPHPLLVFQDLVLGSQELALEKLLYLLRLPPYYSLDSEDSVDLDHPSLVSDRRINPMQDNRFPLGLRLFCFLTRAWSSTEIS